MAVQIQCPHCEAVFEPRNADCCVCGRDWSVDRDPETGEPIDLLERRTPCFGRPKVVVISTPGPKSWAELDFEKALFALGREIDRAYAPAMRKAWTLLPDQYRRLPPAKSGT